MNILRDLLTRSERFAATVEEPVDGRVARRIQHFAGTVRSRYPVTKLSVCLDGVERTVDLMEQRTEAGQGFLNRWSLWAEVAGSGAHGAIRLDVRAAERPILQRMFSRAPFEDRSAPLVFLQHIPKTAGTSLRAALEQHPSIRLFGVYPDPAYMKPQEVEGLSDTAFDDVDVVFGHFYHGLHRRTRRQGRYVTILRHPADLIRSYYLFMKYQTGAYAEHQTIEQAFTHNYPAFDNVITRYIAGISPNTPIDDDVFAAAEQNLARDYVFVGLTEHMAVSTDVIGRMFGVKLADLVTNITPPSAEARQLDRRWIMDRFAPHLRFDIQLYEQARSRFSDDHRVRRS